MLEQTDARVDRNIEDTNAPPFAEPAATVARALRRLCEAEGAGADWRIEAIYARVEGYLADAVYTPDAVLHPRSEDAIDRDWIDGVVYAIEEAELVDDAAMAAAWLAPVACYP